MSEEKRKYRRVALEVEDGYFGTFRLENEKTFVAPILSLSAGGLQFALPKENENILEVGSKLHLRQISGGVNLSFLSDIDVEVRWKEALQIPEYVSIGCELMDLPDSLRDQVIKFVDVERRARGQYRDQ